MLIIVMVDYRKRIIDVEAGWPGSVGDRRIWRNSLLCRQYKDWLSQFPEISIPTGQLSDGTLIHEDVPAFILADSAYPNAKHMVMTFKNSDLKDAETSALNKKLGGARYHVENAFGILKARFLIFQAPLACAREDARIAVFLVCAIFVLHNFLIDIRDSVGREFENDVGNFDQNAHNNGLANNGLTEDGDQENESLETRNILLRHTTWRLDFV